jgi:hypothetical protein
MNELKYINHLNLTIDKNAIIKKGDKVYYEGCEAYKEGVYKLGDWDNWDGFRFIDSYGLPMKGANSSRLNTFLVVENIPDEKPIQMPRRRKVMMWITMILMIILFTGVFLLSILQPTPAKNLDPSGKVKISNQLIYI